MTLVIRTLSDPSRVGAALRDLVFDASREMTISDVKPMQGYLSEAIATPASTTSLFVAFAGLALVLGSIGVYGVISFLVSRRTREIGVRIALGARTGDVLWLIMKEGAKFFAAGIVLGVGGALAIARLLSSELHGVSPMDPITYAGVALVVALVTFLACYVPTRRALRIDPLVALRD